MSAEIISSVRDLQKHFNAGEVHALNGVSVDIEKSEVLVVIGPSGSGKSTFLRCLNLLERPTSGSVVFEGTDITEIIRGGIMSIDHGQFEAGRSIGFTYIQTMRFIIIPQAFKNVLPSLANEFIALLKETAVCGYIGLMDLTKGGDVIRGRTFSAFMPLLAVALIYLLLVIFFSWLVGKLERRLRSSER